VTESNHELIMSLFKQKNNIAVILATFAFTMLGFLAAVITILFSFSKSSTFTKYKRLGHLDVFFAIYYFAIACFIFTFSTAILTLAGSNAGILPMRLSLMSTVNNLGQIALLTLIIVNLCKKAMTAP
jgi:hypothetical protein